MRGAAPDGTPADRRPQFPQSRLGLYQGRALLHLINHGQSTTSLLSYSDHCRGDSLRWHNSQPAHDVLSSSLLQRYRISVQHVERHLHSPCRSASRLW